MSWTVILWFTLNSKSLDEPFIFTGFSGEMWKSKQTFIMRLATFLFLFNKLLVNIFWFLLFAWGKIFGLLESMAKDPSISIWTRLLYYFSVMIPIGKNKRLRTWGCPQADMLRRILLWYFWINRIIFLCSDNLRWYCWSWNVN